MNGNASNKLFNEIFSLRGYLLAAILYFSTSALVQMIT
jgi:hypothetical protein